MKERLAAGWVYGPVKDPEQKTHPALRPYDELSRETRLKDAVFRAIVRAMGPEEQRDGGGQAIGCGCGSGEEMGEAGSRSGSPPAATYVPRGQLADEPRDQLYEPRGQLSIPLVDVADPAAATYDGAQRPKLNIAHKIPELLTVTELVSLVLAYPGACGDEDVG
jgi:hypothetical protein